MYSPFPNGLSGVVDLPETAWGGKQRQLSLKLAYRTFPHKRLSKTFRNASLCSAAINHYVSCT